MKKSMQVTALAAMVVVGGCGWRENHRALVRYQAVVEDCETRADAIVARPGTTREQDMEDLRALRAECEAAEAVAAGGVQ